MLEIGKYYQQHNGVVVGPLREYSGRMASHGFKFCAGAQGIANRMWREDGSFSLRENDKNPYDIVFEVQFIPLLDLTQQPKEEIVSTFKIEAGKFYKNRNGDIRGPMKEGDEDYVSDYCFVDEAGDTYSESGDFDVYMSSGNDLIEEVPNPCDINPEPIMKNNNPTIEEVLSAIQRGDEVIAVDNYESFPVKAHNAIQRLLDAKSFEIKVKQPVVKFKYVYQHLSGSVKTTQDYYESDKEFLTIQGDSADAFEFFEPIQATRKEF